MSCPEDDLDDSDVAECEGCGEQISANSEDGLCGYCRIDAAEERT